MNSHAKTQRLKPASYENHLVLPGTRRNHGIDIFGPVDDKIHEHQTIPDAHRLAQRPFHIARLFDTHADMAISLGELHEVRQGFHVGHGVAALVEELLPLAHHTEKTVVEV